MKRTGFKKKGGQLKRTPFNRKPPREKSSKGLFDYLKKESKAEEWARIKKDILDPLFVRMGLYDTCELQLDKCIGNIVELQYAHSKKRELIAKQEPERTRELCEVVRACTNCHDDIEHLADTAEETGHEQMYRIVVSTINRRNRRLAQYKRIDA